MTSGDAPPSQPQGQSAPSAPHRAPKVLVVERDAVTRAALIEGLKEPRKVRVYEAPSLSAAAQVLKTQQVDSLVIGWVEEAEGGREEGLSAWLQDALRRVRRVVRLVDEAPWSARMGAQLRQSLSDLARSSLEPARSPLEAQDTPKPISSAPAALGRPRNTSPLPALSDPEPLCLLSELPRPSRPTALPELLRLALDPSTLHPVAARVEVAGGEEEEEGALVLWVGSPDLPTCADLRRVCKSLNLKMISVSSAQAALRETRQRRFDVAFVSHLLQDMDGLSLVRSLRREVGDSLPIAFISNHQQVSDRLEGVHAGVSLFLGEGVGVDLLAQSLRQLQSLNTRGSARVLVIDDDEALIADHVTRELAQSAFQVSCLTAPLRVLELLSEVQTDLLVIHADMAGLGGFEVCRTLRATPEWQSLPIVLMGERGDDDMRIAAYRSGADDYLSRRADRAVLKTCLESRLERSRLIQDRADRDGLTGLLLRRAFNDALQARLAAARRQGTPVSVCLIDLDHFKSVNDTYGHIAGDRVLASMGRLLSSSFRVEDLRGRWGGEEFVVAFSGEGAESARVILERARREFVRFYFDGEHGERFQSTFSAGVATFPENGQTIEDLFKVADERLYKVKQSGRNRVLSQDSLEGQGG
jgi:diguanylate cyclase (GGDEF)-like protein